VAYVGVTVNTPPVATAEVFVAVNEAIALPAPAAPIPMVVLLLAQVKVVPVTVLLKLIVDVGAVLQSV